MTKPQIALNASATKVPQTILIDTNIFDKNRYYFGSRWVERFVELATANKSTLLLPDPVEREVLRHIKEQSRAAQGALQKACNEAPLIHRWPNWPGTKAIASCSSEVEAATIVGWTDFLKNFPVERLAYQDIDIAQIMDWYDRQQAPFGEGEKRKEFPDAFIIAAALAYSKRKNVKVAVISDDSGINKACTLHEGLIHFSDLPIFIEALVNEAPKTPAAITAAIKNAIAADAAFVTASVSEQFINLAFYHEEDLEAEVENVEVKSVALSNIRVLSIENGYCTISFDADVEFTAYVEYGDPDTMIIDSSEDFRMPLFMRAGTVTETATLSATAFLDFDETWKEILEVYDLELDNRTIGIETRPSIRHEDEEPDEEEIISDIHYCPGIEAGNCGNALYFSVCAAGEGV